MLPVLPWKVETSSMNEKRNEAHSLSGVWYITSFFIYKNTLKDDDCKDSFP